MLPDKEKYLAFCVVWSVSHSLCPRTGPEYTLMQTGATQIKSVLIYTSRVFFLSFFVFREAE